MSVLTENIVLSRTRAQDLNSVRKLNCWGTEISDVSLVREMPYVEVLSLSVNMISTLFDFSFCRNLQELYIRKNCIGDLNQVVYLQELPRLKSLWLADNPCAECDNYRLTVLRTLPKLEKLDNITVQPSELEQAKSKGRILVRPSLEPDSSSSPEPPLPTPPSRQTVAIHPQQAAHIIAPQESHKIVEEKFNEVHTVTHSVQRSESSSEIAVLKQAKSPPSNAVTPPPPVPSHPTTPKSAPPALEQEHPPPSHHNHAFYARVQTLVDHSSRKPRKMTSELRSNKSAASSPPPPHTNNNMEESAEHLGEMETQYFTSGGGARDYSDQLETRSCSLDSEASYYAEQRATVGSANSRSDKNSPNRILPKGGRNRNSNILSAVLCLIKELDFASLEVVETAIHCQMEDMD